MAIARFGFFSALYFILMAAAYRHSSATQGIVVAGAVLLAFFLLRHDVIEVRGGSGRS